ncbi:glyoxalase/bleomycin resistance/dioxygenase family protein, partial [Vibrio harveyi]|nr:glyoxalase/bleomycin resistance/dioxygenase family protein [Vibrio harveyi]
WSVGNLCVALADFQKLGARLYRGPMEIEDGLSMCQVEDPFGNLIGLRGKTT